MSKKSKKEQQPKEEEYLIKPEKSAPKLDTSNWPLLLKVII